MVVDPSLGERSSGTLKGGYRAEQLKEQARKPLTLQFPVSGIREGPTVCQLTVKVLFGAEATGIGAWGSGGGNTEPAQGAGTQATAAPSHFWEAPEMVRWTSIPGRVGPGSTHAGPLSSALLPDP